jgi:hypothetical protein
MPLPKPLPILLSLALSVPPLGAVPTYVSRIPNGGLNRCANCHINPSPGSSARNPFGNAFAGQGHAWGAALAGADSDGDGIANGQELQDPTGAWTQGQPAPGDPRLVSSPGLSFSTPGERALTLNEVLIAPATGQPQVIEIQNPLATSIDAAGMYLYDGQAFQIPNGQSANTTIPAKGQLRILIDSTQPNIPGRVSDPPAGGLSALSSPGYLSLHWIADTSQQFDVYWTLTDYVQWGGTGQPRESTAASAGQWGAGTSVTAPGAGTTLEFDGVGDVSTDWLTNAMPTLGAGNVEYLLLGLLGQRTLDPAQVFDPDANEDGAVDIADVVLRLVTAAQAP